MSSKKTLDHRSNTLDCDMWVEETTNKWTTRIIYWDTPQTYKELVYTTPTQTLAKELVIAVTNRYLSNK